MKKFLLSLSFLVALASNASAADVFIGIGYANGAQIPMLRILGDIEEGDFEKFVKQVTKCGRVCPAGTFVGLKSNGGLIREAINIGHVIHQKRFSTFAGQTCASACALIWLAGAERVAFENSKIGFHNAYDPRTGQATGAGNAVVGAYLSKLGFNYDAIVYMTKAGADDMAWLDFDKAKELKIKFVRNGETAEEARRNVEKYEKEEEAKKKQKRP